MSHLQHLDPSWQNSSREIAKKYMEDFNRCPCEYHKQKLENIGFTVDFDSKDWGNETRSVPSEDWNESAEYDDGQLNELLAEYL